MSVRKSLAWSYGAQAFSFAQAFAISVIVARILGPYEMGIFAVGASTAGALAIFASFGVGSYLVRLDAVDASIKATAFTVNALLNCLLSAAMFLVVLSGPFWGMNQGVQHVLMLLAITPLIGMFDFLPSTLMQRDMNFRVLSLIAMGRATIASVLTLVLAWNGFGYLSPAVAAVGSALIGTLASNWVARHHVSLKVSLLGWKDITRFGLQMMSIGGLATFVQRMTELILTHFLGIAALGIYTRASSLASQIWDNVYGLSTRVIYAQMAKELRETGTVRKTFSQGLSMISAAIGPLVAGIAVLSAPLIHTLYGDKWQQAAAPLSMLMIVFLVSLPYGLNWELCVLRGRTGWQARNEAIRAGVVLVTFTIGSMFSVTAAAAGRIFEALCGLLLFAPKMREMGGTEPGEIVGICKQSTLLTVAAVGPSFALMLSTGWSPHTSWLLIGPAIATGILLWLVLLTRLRHPLLDEISRAARALKRKRGAAPPTGE